MPFCHMKFASQLPCGKTPGCPVAALEFCSARSLSPFTTQHLHVPCSISEEMLPHLSSPLTSLSSPHPNHTLCTHFTSLFTYHPLSAASLLWCDICLLDNGRATLIQTLTFPPLFLSGITNRFAAKQIGENAFQTPEKKQHICCLSLSRPIQIQLPLFILTLYLIITLFNSGNSCSCCKG